MKWISPTELVLIHERVIEVTGGIHGVTNPGGVESALARPFTAFAGEALFPGLPDKIAALIHSIIAFHPFADGNKRTAVVGADVCLRLNGYRLTPSDEVEPFFWAVARGEKSVEEVAAWVASHMEAWDES
jgi:death-on-curing protein